MTYPGFPIFLILLISCLNLTGQEIYAKKIKTFSSNIYYQSHRTITITYLENKVLVDRSESKILNDFETYNILFVDTDNIELDTAGFINLIDPNRYVWFIPFEFGKAAFRLGDDKKWLRYSCNCRGMPGMPGSGICAIRNGGDSIWCASVKGMSCFVNELGCLGATGTFNKHEDSFYDFYSGGVLLETDSVTIKDPDYFKPVPPIEFIEDENGNLLLRSDYEKLHGTKKD